jgi:RNA polymerase sigma-70 factor (ECF subfamily)
VKEPAPATPTSAPYAAPDLAALSRGDEGAWADLVRTAGPRLLAVARRLVKDEAGAEDCVQDAFVQAYRNVSRFEGRSAVSTWLHRITVNSALALLRSRRRHPEEPIDPLLPVFDRSGYRVPVGAVTRDPEELAGRAEAREVIRNAIDLLPETYRTVLVLRDLEELSGEETAQILETNPNVVKVRLHRARAALKTLVEMPLAPVRISRVREICRWVLGAPGRAIPLVISCRQFEEFVMDFIEGSLPPDRRRLFELHLKTCHECRRYLARYQATLAATREVARDPTPPPEVPLGLVRAVAQSVRAT